MIRYTTLLIALAFLITGCSTAKVKGTWKDVEIAEKVDRILVVGVAIRKNRRQLFETTLVKKLEKHGVRAIPSFTVFPKEEMSQEATSEYIKKQKIDSVLVVKVLNSKSIKKRVAETTAHTVRERPIGAPYYSRFNGWYADYTYWTTTVGTYDTGYVLSNFEANLYQKGNESMVWSTFVEVNANDDDSKGVNDFVNALVKQMKKDGLI